jgi:hypothetical protein
VIGIKRNKRGKKSIINNEKSTFLNVHNSRNVFLIKIKKLKEGYFKKWWCS